MVTANGTIHCSSPNTILEGANINIQTLNDEFQAPESAKQTCEVPCDSQCIAQGDCPLPIEGVINIGTLNGVVRCEHGLTETARITVSQSMPGDILVKTSMAGRIDAPGITSNGTILIQQANPEPMVTATGRITVGNLDSSLQEGAVRILGDLDGTLVLDQGISTGQLVNITKLGSTGIIDLSGQDVNGTLSLGSGEPSVANAGIIYGGTVAGTSQSSAFVTLASGSSNTFASQATFNSVNAFGTIRTASNADFGQFQQQFAP